jgi:3-hydroxybutyryl-CoA dehydrogenase
MIRKIAVLGAGTMGMGVAESFAMYGLDVHLWTSKSAETIKQKIAQDLQILVEEAFITAEQLQATIDNVKVFSDQKAAVIDRDYVIENVPENLKIKQDTFHNLDSWCPEHTIFASNTTTLPLSKMMELVGEKRRERMMICHWFNPPAIMPIVELSFYGNTSEAVYKEVEQLFKKIKKQTVKVLKEVPGMVAARIQQGIAREAFSLIEQGVAAPEDVDKALKFGPAFRYATTGQMEVADFGGLDIWLIAGDNLLKVMDNSQCGNPLMRQKVKEGKLGIKTGEGFYQYKAEEIPAIRKKFAQRLIHQLKASQYYVVD